MSTSSTPTHTGDEHTAPVPPTSPVAAFELSPTQHPMPFANKEANPLETSRASPPPIPPSLSPEFKRRRLTSGSGPSTLTLSPPHSRLEEALIAHMMETTGVITSLLEEGLKQKEQIRELTKQLGATYEQQRKIRTTQANIPSSKPPQDRGTYKGKNPKCSICDFHHHGHCDQQRCQRCGKIGHAAKDCRVKLKFIPTPQPRTLKGCFKCGKPGHLKRDCPYLGAVGNRNNNNNAGTSL